MSKCENCLSKNVCRWYENGTGKNLCCADDFPCPEQKDKDRFIETPCKVGDIVYVKYSGAIEYFVISKVIHNGSNSFDFEADLENEDGYTIASIEFGTVEIGRTVFLTKEEAEAKLKELKDNGNL